MPRPSTARLLIIARGLEHDGWKQQAAEVRRVVGQRDNLLETLVRIRPGLTGMSAGVADAAIADVEKP